MCPGDLGLLLRGQGQVGVDVPGEEEELRGGEVVGRVHAGPHLLGGEHEQLDLGGEDQVGRVRVVQGVRGKGRLEGER